MRPETKQQLAKSIKLEHLSMFCTLKLLLTTVILHNHESSIFKHTATLSSTLSEESVRLVSERDSSLSAPITCIEW